MINDVVDFQDSNGISDSMMVKILVDLIVDSDMDHELTDFLENYDPHD